MEGFGISRALLRGVSGSKKRSCLTPDSATRLSDLEAARATAKLTYEEPATHLAEGRGGWLGGALVLGGHGIVLFGRLIGVLL